MNGPCNSYPDFYTIIVVQSNHAVQSHSDVNMDNKICHFSSLWVQKRQRKRFVYEAGNEVDWLSYWLMMMIVGFLLTQYFIAIHWIRSNIKDFHFLYKIIEKSMKNISFGALLCLHSCLSSFTGWRSIFILWLIHADWNIVCTIKIVWDIKFCTLSYFL